MAFVSSLGSFPCKPTSLTLRSKSTLSPFHTITMTSNNKPNLHNPRILKAQAMDGDSNKVAGEGVTGTVGFETTKEQTDTEVLKKALFDLLLVTDGGSNASSEARIEIIELISQLEAKNPTPAPTQAPSLLNGKWILAYTSLVGSPLLKIEEISEIVDTENFTVQTSFLFAGPCGTTTLSTNGKFEFRGPKRVHVKFEEGVIGSPQFKESTELPEDVDFLGHKINLSLMKKGLITSLQDAASSVAKTISIQSPFQFPIPSDIVQFWLVYTYLDEELRIFRGDGGSVFVEYNSR